VHIQEEKNTAFYDLIDNTNKIPSIKIYTFTYNSLISRHVSIFLDHPQGVLHQTSLIIQNTFALQTPLVNVRLPEDDLRGPNKTCRSISELHVKLYILILVHFWVLSVY